MGAEGRSKAVVELTYQLFLGVCLSGLRRRLEGGGRKEAAIEQARQLPCASAPVRVCVCASGTDPLGTGWLAELLCFAATPMQRSKSGGDGACLFI
jgi:hypothetical protein